MEAKKLSFYLLLVLIFFIFQIYIYPFFFLWGLVILIFFTFECREVYFFLITSLILDLVSSLPFGFFFIFSLILFFFSQWLFNSFFKEWNLFIFSVWFFFWQILYVLSYLLFSHFPFNFLLILKSALVSEIFAIIIFVLFSRIKDFLFKYGFVVPKKTPIIKF